MLVYLRHATCRSFDPVRGMAMAVKYYKLLIHRLHWWELSANSTNAAVFPILAVFKLIRWAPITVSVPLLDELPLVDWDDLDDAVRGGLRRSVEGLVGSGWEYLYCYELPYVEPTRVGGAAVLLAPDRRCAAAVVYYKDPEETRAAVAYGTPLDGGDHVLTINSRLYIEHPPEVLGEWLPKQSRSAAYTRHCERLQEFEADGRRLLPMTADSLPAMTLHLERQMVLHNLDRGVIRPMTAAEVRRLRG
ncbi:MAG: hypothetical protein ACRC7O_12105 [Fimbriiglobus sp.]